jgi:heme/copper-type cytochrome/quinol oxidase subunit 3
MTELVVGRPDATPGARPTGWWGMVLLIATEATLFALLLATNAYGSIFYALVGLHFVHVAVGGLLALWALARTWRFDRTAIVTVRVTALYWYFLAVVAAVVFLTLYLSPRG